MALVIFVGSTAKADVTFFVCGSDKTPISAVKSNIVAVEPPPPGNDRDTDDDGKAIVPAGTKTVYVKPLRFKNLYEEGAYQVPADQGKLILTPKVKFKTCLIENVRGGTLTADCQGLTGPWTKLDRRVEMGKIASVPLDGIVSGYQCNPKFGGEFKGYIFYRSELSAAAFGQIAAEDGTQARLAFPSPDEISQWKSNADLLSDKENKEDNAKALILYTGVATWTNFAARVEPRWNFDVKTARKGVLIQAGKLLNVDNPLVQEGGDFAASPTLTEKVKYFQGEVKLEQTGLLDIETILKLTKIQASEVGVIIKKAGTKE